MIAFSNGLTRGGSDIFSLDYNRYDYLEQQRLDHPYDDSFYMPPLREPLFLSGALIEQAINDDKITSLHLSDLSYLENDEMRSLLELVKSRTWKFVEVGAAQQQNHHQADNNDDGSSAIRNMLAILDSLIENDNCERFAGGCLFEKSNNIVADRLCNWLQSTQILRYVKFWGKISSQSTAQRFIEQIATCSTLEKVELGHLRIPMSSSSGVNNSLAQKKELSLIDAIWNNHNIQYLYLYYSESHVQPVKGFFDKFSELQQLEEGENSRGDEQQNQRGRTFKYAFVPDCKNTQLELIIQNNLIQHLHVQRCSHLLPSIANGLLGKNEKSKNTTLKILDLSRHTYNTSEVKELWKAIQHDSCLEIISFRGASFVLESSQHSSSSSSNDGPRIVGVDYLASIMPEMAGLARVLFVNRSRWLQGTYVSAAWPEVIDKVNHQFIEGGLGHLETVYHLLRHRLDWLPT